jgi:alpha-galactosidase
MDWKASARVLFVLAVVANALCAAGALAEDPAADSADNSAAPAPQLPPNAVWLDEIPLTHCEEAVQIPYPRQSVYEKPLTVAGTVYSRGIGTHSLFEWMLDVRGAAETFEAWVGVDDETKNRGTVVFEVWADEVCVFRSGVMRCGDPVQHVQADLRGAQKVLLATRTAGDGMGYDHGDWCNAYIVMEPGAAERPVPIPIEFDTTPMPIAEIDRAELGIWGPRVTGATPGKPFLFRIPASGKGQLSFRAKGLPKGLYLDRATGIISGSVAEAGTWVVRLKVKDDEGEVRRDLTIRAGRNMLAQTPPMGWNSWNAWYTAQIDEKKVREAADAMASSGLAAKGYQYVNIDDGWVGERDESGKIAANEYFPDMSALTDYIHSFGLKCGLYSSPGPRTCCGHEGSYQHEVLDAERYAEWGFDYLKYDWCSYEELAGLDAPLSELQEPYRKMGEALLNCPRDIVFSMGQGGMGEPWLWAHEFGANLWRDTWDISDQWGPVVCLGMTQIPLAQYAGPGHWNDPDMLIVGMISWGTAKQHPTGLRPNEQISHFTMWSMVAAPLLLGCDLTKLDPFTFNLIANPEVIDVDQDPLGKAAERLPSEGAAEIWIRPLFDGTRAVSLLNQLPWKQTIVISPQQLGVAAGSPVRDLWQRRDIGPLDGEMRLEVAPRGAVLLRVGEPGAVSRSDH